MHHHLHRHRLRRPLAAMALAAVASFPAQGSETLEASDAAVAGTSVGGGIGYGVDADRPRIRVVAQAAPSRERASPAGLDVVDSSASWLPSTRTGYAGLNIGKTSFGQPCGAGGFSCKQARPSLHLYAGSMLNDFLGLELGYRFLGRAERGGGRTEAQALGLGLRGRLAAGPSWHLFAKLGLEHAQSRVSASPASLLPSGSARGWVGSYGAGVGWDMTSASALVLEWASVELPFASAGKQAVDNTSVGFVHQF